MISPYTHEYRRAIQNGSANSARVIVPMLVDLVHPTSVIDVGCGSGLWLSVFQQSGVEKVFGVDGAYIDPKELHIDAHHFMPADLNSPPVPTSKFDLALCLEVAEHLRPSSARPLVEYLTTLSPIVAFSAAIPGQGGHMHINEQWPGYWKSLFARHGFTQLDSIRWRTIGNPEVAWWYQQNLFVYAHEQLIASCPLLSAELERSNNLHMNIVHDVVVGKYCSASGLIRQTWNAVLRAVRNRLT